MNLNKEKIKYLTREDLEAKYKKELEKDVSTSYMYKEIPYQYYIDELNNLHNKSLDIVIENLLYVPFPYDDFKFLNDYINLFDINHPNRYDLLKKLTDIYERDILRCDKFKAPNNKLSQLKDISQGEKMEILQKSFDIFKQLKNRDRILNYMFAKEKTEIENTNNYQQITTFVVSDILLNTKSFFDFLLHKFNYQDKKLVYNKILKNILPNSKNNER